MLLQKGEIPRQERRGLGRGQAPLRTQAGPRLPGLDGERLPGHQAAVRDRSGRRGEHVRSPEAGAQDERVRPGSWLPGGQIRRHQGDQVVQPAPPGLVTEHPERDLGHVHRRDPAPVRRGQQRGPGRSAGQLGHRAVGQLHRQRAHRQRMRGEGRREIAAVLGVPPEPIRVLVRPGPGSGTVR